VFAAPFAFCTFFFFFFFFFFFDFFSVTLVDAGVEELPKDKSVHCQYPFQWR
jgi:hypothetical protein